MLDFAGADAVRQRAEGAVRRGVRVTADDGHSGQDGAGLGAYDMDNSLALGQKREIGGCAVLADIGVERRDLLAADRIGDAVVPKVPVGGRRIVVGGGDDGADAPDLPAALAQSFEGLGAGDLVDQVAVYVQDGSTVILAMDDVFVPDLVIQRSAHCAVSFQG